ncbi:MAG: pilin [Candidatus Saccharimonadales bacterium]
MKRLLQRIIASLIIVTGLVMTTVAIPVGALNIYEKGCSGSSAPTVKGATGSSAGGAAICGAKDQDNVPDILKNVVNTILFVLGMVAVIMIVIGGIRYTTSNGEAGSIKGAKDTILYAVVGLVVAILSYAIVNFVLGRFTN